MSDVPALPDGTYDAFVVDADDDADDADRMHLSVTILAGEHKGEVVELTATGLAGTSIDLIGMPATLTVADGSPSLRIDEP
ncbi:MAG: hypothetical protein ACLFWR_03035 [Acidimicrobiales bacterium]